MIKLNKTRLADAQSGSKSGVNLRGHMVPHKGVGSRGEAPRHMMIKTGWVPDPAMSMNPKGEVVAVSRVLSLY